MVPLRKSGLRFDEREPVLGLEDDGVFILLIPLETELFMLALATGVTALKPTCFGADDFGSDTFDDEAVCRAPIVGVVLGVVTSGVVTLGVLAFGVVEGFAPLRPDDFFLAILLHLTQRFLPNPKNPLRFGGSTGDELLSINPG